MGDTRAIILETALRQFAEHGFDQTTSVRIAHEAGVDPALVLYYFDSKEAMFFEAIRERLYPQLQVAFAGSDFSPRIGEQIVDAFLGLWDLEGQGRAMAALVRAGISNDRISRLFQDFLGSVVLPEVSRRTRSGPGQFRVGLAATQLIGLGIARYVLRLEPVAEARREELVATIGPTITRYLTGPAGPTKAPRARGHPR